MATPSWTPSEHFLRYGDHQLRPILCFPESGVNTTAYTRCNPSSAWCDGQQGGVGAPSQSPRFGPQFDSTIEVITGKTERWEAQVWA